MRPGEKMHEILIPEDEARNALEFMIILWSSQFSFLGK